MKSTYIKSMEYIRYFAYGSCMDQVSLSQSLGVDVAEYFSGAASLPNFRLTFNYASVTENVCFANIVACPGTVVEGALFRLPTSLLLALDKREGVSSSRYGRCTVEIKYNDQLINALSYHGLVTLPFEAAPSLRYRRMLEQGLLDAKVSQEYFKEVFAHLDMLPERVDMDM